MKATGTPEATEADNLKSKSAEMMKNAMQIEPPNELIFGMTLDPVIFKLKYKDRVVDMNNYTFAFMVAAICQQFENPERYKDVSLDWLVDSSDQIRAAARKVLPDKDVLTVSDLITPAKEGAKMPLELILEKLIFADNKGLTYTKKPQRTAHSTDIVTRSFFKNEIHGKKSIQTGYGRNTGKRTEILAGSFLEELPPNVLISREPGSFDKIVYIHVCTLIEAGNYEFTLHMIYRSMTGNSSKKASPEMLTLIDESMMRLRCINLVLTSGTWGDEYGQSFNEQTEHVIECTRNRKVTFNQSGAHEVITYEIIKEPILYRCAKAMKQIAKYDPLLLDVPINTTSEMLVIVHYLAERVEGLKRTNPLEPKIEYETIFAEINITASSDAALRKKKTGLRKRIRTVLDEWKRSGFIADWQEYKEGKTIKGVEILMPKSKKLATVKPEKLVTENAKSRKNW
jgi:hypothetical protein